MDQVHLCRMSATSSGPTITLLLGVHCHQPVGNFPWVIAQAYEQAYAPFVDALERHPRIRCALHYTGPLWDWLQEHRSGFLPRVAALAKRGQVELLGGGYYEPILPLIPEADRQGQLAQQSAAIQRLTGRAPRGAWLAERVWEPELACTLAQAGLDYTILDDTHFRPAVPFLPPQATVVNGDGRDILGYYMTEDQGRTLALFPASKHLRYAIPFKQPQETIDLLRRLARGEDYAITFADDGEKFGFWPGTHQWVHEERWLERFFEALEAHRDWIHLRTFSEALDAAPPRGRVYLPHASYEEMMEWSGGNFRNFLVKYPEANLMHKRMLDTSGRLRAAQGASTHGRSAASAPTTQRRAAQLADARRHLYMAQCNCAYWHGVFGGLYLGHLRSAVFHHLIEAERSLAQATHRTARWVERRTGDLDGDGEAEVVVRTPHLGLYIDPAEGGSLTSLDDMAHGCNLMNTLTRRPEPYHEQLKQAEPLGVVVAAAAAVAGGKQPASIHDLMGAKEQGLAEYLVYDRYRRAAFLDHCFDRAVTAHDLMRQSIPEVGEVLGAPYTLRPSPARGASTSVTVTLEREAAVRNAQGHARALRIEKRYQIPADRPSFTVSYRLRADGPLTIWWGSELNLLVKDASLTQAGEAASLSVVELNDQWQSLKVRLRYARPATLLYYPLETVSESEEGLERTYQGLCLCAVWPVTLAPGAVWSAQVEMTLETLPCPA